MTFPKTRKSVPTVATSPSACILIVNSFAWLEALEAEGKVEKAWALLYEEWLTTTTEIISTRKWAVKSTSNSLSCLSGPAG